MMMQHAANPVVMNTCTRQIGVTAPLLVFAIISRLIYAGATSFQRENDAVNLWHSRGAEAQKGYLNYDNEATPALPAAEHETHTLP